MSANGNDPEPAALVARFLDLLADRELDAAADLLSADVVYTNVSLPTMHGRERVRRALHSALGRPGAGFEVYVHSSATNGPTVLNERTDVLIYRRLRTQFWVYGRFEVHDGEITLWRDSFDWLNITLALLRGLAGAVIPAIAARPPS